MNSESWHRAQWSKLFLYIKVPLLLLHMRNVNLNTGESPILVLLLWLQFDPVKDLVKVWICSNPKQEKKGKKEIFLQIMSCQYSVKMK